MLFKNKPRYLLLIVLFFGFLLRLSFFTHWGFGFDQVQIIDAAIKIAHGDITLIGPRTGPATLFTGPLIYYITCFFYVIGFGYYSIIVTTLFISLTTGLTLYFLVTRYFDKVTAFFAVSLWAFSNFLIGYDQVTWNPNITLLASILFFFPILEFIKNGNLKRIDYIYLFVGSFLGYQAHFSCLLFLPLSLLVFLSKNKKLALIPWLVILTGFTFSILPTLVFDIKHDWLNTRGLLEFTDTLSSNGNSSGIVLYHFWKSFYTTFESFGSLVLKNFTVPLRAVFVFGLVIFIIYFYKVFIEAKKISPFSIAPIIWILSITIIFSFYKGDKPPYYFIIQIPAFLTIYFYFFNSIKNFSNYILIAFLFITLSLFNSSAILFEKSPFSLHNSLRIQKYISKQSNDTKISSFTYHIPVGEYFGLEFLLKDTISSNTEGKQWYLSYPAHVVFAMENFDGVQVWSTEAKTPNENIYFDNEFRVRTTEELSLYRDTYYRGDADQSYIVLQNGGKIAQLNRYALINYRYNFPDVKINGQNSWQVLTDQKALWYYPPTQSIFILETTKNVEKTFHENITIF